MRASLAVVPAAGREGQCQQRAAVADPMGRASALSVTVPGPLRGFPGPPGCNVQTQNFL